MTVPNAVVEYVDGSGRVVARDEFYDPGLDPASDYARDWVRRNKVAYVRHLAYQCGRPINGGAHAR